jgi:hypothetical protein
MLSKTSTTKIVEHDVDFGLTLTISSNGAMRAIRMIRHGCYAEFPEAWLSGGRAWSTRFMQEPVLIFSAARSPDEPSRGRVLHDSGKVMQGPGSRFRVRATSRPG